MLKIDISIMDINRTEFQEANPSRKASSQEQISRWPEPSRPPGSPPEERLRVSSSPPRPPERARRQPEESRNPTGTDPEPWRFGKSDATKSPQSSSCGSYPSRGSFARSLRTSRTTFDSREPPSSRSRRPPRRTSSPSSRTPTSAPSTPSG